MSTGSSRPPGSSGPPGPPGTSGPSEPPDPEPPSGPIGPGGPCTDSVSGVSTLNADLSFEQNQVERSTAGNSARGRLLRLDVQEADILRVALDERAPGLHVL